MRCSQRISATVWELEVFRPTGLDLEFASWFVMSVGTPGFAGRWVKDERGADFSSFLAKEDPALRFAFVWGVRLNLFEPDPRKGAHG